MPTIRNKDLYKGNEYKEWATQTELVSDEQFLLRKYLNPHAITLEAGTAGGRILYALKGMGFTSLYGFDFVPEFIEAAKAKDPTGSIDFQVYDAACPDYPDAMFEQLLYVQQILSIVETDVDRRKTLREAYRIAKPGALMLISFLSWDSRVARPLHAAYTSYLRALRALKGSATPIQAQPWLKVGGAPNYGALTDAGPYLHYFTLDEITEHLSASGFQLLEIGSTYQISNDKALCGSVEELKRQPIRGGVFAVCRKPD